LLARVTVLLHVHVHEVGRLRHLIQEAPALHPVVGALQFVERDRLIVAPRSATVRARVGKSQQLKHTLNYLECPTCHTAIDLVKRESGPAIVHTLCLNQVEQNGIRAIDLGKGFGVEQFVVAYKASTLKRSVLNDLLEWLVR
jgi:DNA-binding transcriptional LysR family regulator